MTATPPKPTDNNNAEATTKKPETPATAEAAGAQQKFEAEANESLKPPTGTPAEKAPDAPTNTPAAQAPADGTPGATADKTAEGDKPGEADEEAAPSLYERTFGKFDSLDEVKGLFGFGKKATAADAKILGAVQLDDPNAKAKLAQDGKPALTLDQPLRPGAKPGVDGADTSSLWSPSSWNWRTFTPDFAEKTVANIGNTIKEDLDWISSWYDTNKTDLKTLDSAKTNSAEFTKLTEDTVLSKGSSVTREQADQTLSSKLPPGRTPDQIREMLNHGLKGDNVEHTLNKTDSTEKSKDESTGARRTENPDGSVTLWMPGEQRGTGVRVTKDAQGNETWTFSDGVLRESKDGKITSSFGDWQKEQIAGSKDFSAGLRLLERASEVNDVKVEGKAIEAKNANDGITREMLAGQKGLDGKPLTAEQVREMLKHGIPGAKTETMTMKGHEGSKVQDVNGIKRIESPDGKTTTIKFPDGTQVVENEKGLTWTKPGKDGKPPDILTESADHKQFVLYPGDPNSDILQGFNDPDSVRQRMNNMTDKTVAEMIESAYDKLTAKPPQGEGKSHQEALEALAKEQIIGGVRSEDGRRRSGFLQQIDGQWYQVNSNGKEIHLRAVDKGEDGSLQFGDQFKFNKETGSWVDTKGNPTDLGPKFKTNPDGSITVGDKGGLQLSTTGETVTAIGALHTLTANGRRGDSTFSSSNKNPATGEKLDAVVAETVDTKMTEHDKVVQEGKIGPEGQIDHTMIRRNPETGVLETNQAELLPNGDIRIPGLNGMTFKANGDIVSGDGRNIYSASSNTWSGESGIVGGQFHGMTRAEAQRAMAEANSASAKATTLGSLALSIAKSGNPNSLSIMRSLAWAGIAAAEAGIAAAGGFSPALVTLSLSKSINYAALSVEGDQSKALAKLTSLGIFDASSQNRVMLAGAYGSTHVSADSPAIQLKAERDAESQPKLKLATNNFRGVA